MSWNTVTTGIRAASMVNSEKRKQRLEELNAHIKGYELDNATGKYVANERGALKEGLETEKLQRDLTYVSEQNNMMQSVLNEQALTSATSALLMGDHETANHAITSNPLLKQGIQKHFGVVHVAPIDWEKDATLFEQHGIIINKDALKDPKVKQAFNSAFSKVIKADGSVDILGTEQLAKETNYLNYLPPRDRSTAINRFNMLKQIVSGHITTPEEQAAKLAKERAKYEQVMAKAEAEKAKAVATITESSYKQQLASIKKHHLDQFFKDNPNATLADYLATTKAGKQVDPEMQKQKVESQKYKTEQQKYKTEEEKLKLEALKQENQQAKETVKSMTPEQKAITAQKVLTDPNPDMTAIEAARDYESTSIKKKLINPKKLEDIRTNAEFVNDFKSIQKDLKNIDTGVISNITTDIKKIVGVSGSKEDAAKKLAKLRLDTKIGLTLRRFLKFMSGAAVSNDEFKGYVGLLQGGSMADETALRQTVDAFTKTLQESVARSNKNISMDAPYTAYKVKKILGTHTNQTGSAQSSTAPVVQQTPNTPAPAATQSTRPKLEDFER